MSKAFEPDFWNLSAAVCERHGVSASLLIPMVHNHLNDDPAKVSVDFHCNVMKAESLLERAIANARSFLAIYLNELKDVSEITGISCRPQPGLLDTYRKLAELTLEYYRLGVDISIRGKDQSRDPSAVPQVLRESIRYQACDRNPFLLIDGAETPILRHRAYGTVRALLKFQPWLGDIWEGLLRRGDSLSDVDAMAGPPPDPNPFKGPNWSWPPTFQASGDVHTDPPHPELFEPRMFVYRPLFNSGVNLRITAKAELAARARGADAGSFM